MTWKKKFVFALCLFLGVGVAFYLMRPTVFFLVDGKILSCQDAIEGGEIKVSFLHSVQKTIVEEFLEVQAEKKGFVLRKTRYQSFGVGLPFLLAEGDFRREGDYFVLDDMRRFFPSLAFRLGKGTHFTLVFWGKEYRLYEDYKDGTLVEIFIAPYVRIFFL